MKIVSGRVLINHKADLPSLKIVNALLVITDSMILHAALVSVCDGTYLFLNDGDVFGDIEYRFSLTSFPGGVSNIDSNVEKSRIVVISNELGALRLLDDT